MIVARGILCFLLPLLLAACGGNDQPSSGTADPSPTAGAAPSAAAGPAVLTDGDLTAFARGLRREIDAVRSAQQRSRDAKTAQERGEAIQESFETATMTHGAEAAGLPLEKYRAMRETVDEIFRTLDVQGKIDGPISMDLTRVDEATRARLLRDPFTDLTPDSAAALRAHMDRLVPIWIEYVRMTAVAG